MIGRFGTVAQVAETIGVSRTTVNRWIKTGKLPATRIGPRNYVVDLFDIVPLIKRSPDLEK